MNLGIAFAPLVAEPVLWAAIAAAVILALLLFVSRSRGATIRALALGLVVLALANPSLTREDRDPLSSVAVVVVDKSPSQNFGDRTQQTEAARAAVVERLSHIPGLDVRVVEAGQSDGETDGTRLFTALGTTLADVPTDRVAGVIMITDGRVHDVPQDSRRARLRRAHSCAHHRHQERARSPRRVDRRAALRHRRPVADHYV